MPPHSRAVSRQFAQASALPATWPVLYLEAAVAGTAAPRRMSNDIAIPPR